MPEKVPDMWALFFCPHETATMAIADSNNSFFISRFWILRPKNTIKF